MVRGSEADQKMYTQERCTVNRSAGFEGDPTTSGTRKQRRVGHVGRVRYRLSISIARQLGCSVQLFFFKA
jgi:hypothetical protein